MKLNNTTYLFGKVKEGAETSNCFEYDGVYYYFKLVLDEDTEELKLVDTCNRYVPVHFSDLCSFRDTITKAVNDIVVDTVGANYAVS